MAERTLILGLDIAGRTGITIGAVGERPEILSKRFRIDENEPLQSSCGRAVAYMAQLLKNTPPKAIFVEALIPENILLSKGISNHLSQNVRVGLWGAVTGVATAKGVCVFAVSVHRVRTMVLGQRHGIKGGDLQKKAIFQWCKEKGWDPPDLDGSDSAAIWFYGCHEVKFGLLENQPWIRSSA